MRFGPKEGRVLRIAEQKLGINASPTAVLQFGESDGAIGELVGEESRGLENMFVMMNAARFAVGVQGIALSDRAYQRAAAYAKEGVQCRPVDGSTRDAVAIIRHPDVRRMLSMMRALTEAARALAAAAQADIGHRHKDSAVRVQTFALYEFLVPVIKGRSTEIAQDVTSLGVQVHGGMGYLEETGAALYCRDARILLIYEGTTAIQANDLIGRKTARDDGAVAYALIDEVKRTLKSLDPLSGRPYASTKKQLDRSGQGHGKAQWSSCFPSCKVTRRQSLPGPCHT